MGNATRIDWVHASLGDPLADVARTELLTLTASLSAPTLIDRWAGYWFSAILRKAYLKAYFATFGSSIEQMHKWRTVIAVSRLGIDIPAETTYLCHRARQGLKG